MPKQTAARGYQSVTEDTSLPKAVQQQTKDQSKKTEKPSEEVADRNEQATKQEKSHTNLQGSSRETKLPEKNPKETNYRFNSYMVRRAENSELQDPTKTKVTEDTSLPKAVQQQTKDQSKKTEKPSEEVADRNEQATKQEKSHTNLQGSSRETKLPEKNPKETNYRRAENSELQDPTKTKVFTEKISVVILGNEQSLKKALITIILGNDLSELAKRKTLTNTMIHENEAFVFSCTPALRTPCDDITELLSTYPPPDVCLLVVKDGFSTEHVQQQIEELKKKTGKPGKQFTVVLPMRHKHTDYPFKSCTLMQLMHELDKMAEDKKTTSTRSFLRTQSEDQVQNSSEPPSVSASHYITKRTLTDTKVNLVLLGMSGTGKSVSGNTILRKTVFTSKPSSRPVTTECQVAETEINGTHVRVIDTPDIFDDDIEESVKIKHVNRCKELCESGPCVFVLVMHVSRFTDGERDVLRKLEKAFGNKVRDQTVILFTRGDDLQQADMSLEEFLHSCQPGLKDIIHKCGNRCAVFENRGSESDQVEKLMDAVIRVLNTTAERE